VTGLGLHAARWLRYLAISMILESVAKIWPKDDSGTHPAVGATLGRICRACRRIYVRKTFRNLAAVTLIVPAAVSKPCENRHTPLHRFHDLRHKCAALLIAQGAHPKEIRERMGHSTILITFDRDSCPVGSARLLLPRRRCRRMVRPG
jgi:integrase